VRIHVVSLPHTLLTRDYDWCAYTAKVRRFAGMLAMAGRDFYLYGPDVYDKIDVVGAEEYVPIVTEADRIEWFGAPEWDRTKVFDRWTEEDPAWAVTNQRAAEAIRERWQPGDVIGIIGGLCQRDIITRLGDLNPMVTEWGIGYSGVIPGTFKVYESYAWMHHIAGFYRDDEMRFFDAVIPNCFDVTDFKQSDAVGEYALYMGRPNPRKGLPIIADIAQRIDLPVLIAGQEGPEIPGTEYVGLVTGTEKAELLAGALCLLTPTTYLEPFGGVAVEAMLSGTPVVATDYGAFTETVVNGVTGYRCRMLGDFIDAIGRCRFLDRHEVVEHTLARYTTSVGSDLYGAFFDRLETLHGDGWYAQADVLADAFRPSRTRQQ
jgi:glycosyltransferase involved in cell wall biosynthesis